MMKSEDVWMNRTVKFVVSCIAVAALLMTLAGCASQTYVPPTQTASVDTPAIGKTKTLRVGVNTSNAPFASQASGRVVGLDVDLAAALADKLGLKLEIIDVGSDPQRAITQGEVDIVMGLTESSTTESWLSDPYIDSAVALFAPASTTTLPQSGQTPRIAAQTSSMSAWEVSNQFGNDAVIPSQSLVAAFEHLSAGDAQYVAADAVVGSYVLASQNLDHHIVGLMTRVNGYCIGVKANNTELQTAVSHALQTLVDSGVVGVIESKWLGEHISLTGMPLTERMSTHNTDATSSQTTGDETESLEDVLGEGQMSEETSSNTASVNASSAATGAASLRTTS